MKNNDNHYYKWFKEKYLSRDQRNFINEYFITPLIIHGEIVKDDINWDGSDKDDVIVFMVGIANMKDNVCASILTNDENAENFLDILADKKHSQHKQAMKDLAKWKKVASAS